MKKCMVFALLGGIIFISQPETAIGQSLSDILKNNEQSFQNSAQDSHQRIEEQRRRAAQAAAERERQRQLARPVAPLPSNQSPSSQTAEQRGPVVSPDGWVRIDGKTIGRVWSSFGWNISCNNGYNTGYGSGSAFGGSFKVEARNRDEAAGFLLRACRR